MNDLTKRQKLAEKIHHLSEGERNQEICKRAGITPTVWGDALEMGFEEQQAWLDKFNAANREVVIRAKSSSDLAAKIAHLSKNYKGCRALGLEPKTVWQAGAMTQDEKVGWLNKYFSKKEKWVAH